MNDATVRTDGSDSFGRHELGELAVVESFPCVSLYLPTHRAGADVGQDPVRLRNLLATAERELASLDTDRRDVDELLMPARNLLDDPDFWRFQADGLALFLAPGVFRLFRAVLAFDELAVVSTQFHVRPLLPLLSGDEAFWLLALSQNVVRLFHCSRHTITPTDTGDTPTSIAEALAHEDPEKQLQVRSSGATGTGQFHGHGGGGEADKAELERYFRAVDRGLAGILDADAPLIVASVGYYGPIYRSVSAHPHIVEDVVAGSPDELSANELHARAWPLIEREFDARRERLQDRYAQNRANDRTAEGLADVRAAATEGRIAMLLVPRAEHRWATTGDYAAPREPRHPGDLDLLNDIALRVLRTGGEVVVVADDEMPGGVVIAAILRFAQSG
ncbi:MAG TPA: hypothetical protein VM282_19305 [Acidimicrobiales bacterium]|nr:hypothetical protein [Acidimicrobiales bacterium]